MLCTLPRLCLVFGLRDGGRNPHRQQQPSPGRPGTPTPPPVCLCPVVSLTRQRHPLQHRCKHQDLNRYPAAEPTAIAGGFGFRHLLTHPGEPAPSGPPLGLLRCLPGRTGVMGLCEQGTPRSEAHRKDPCSAVCPVLRIVEDREGTLDKIGVGRTKDNGAATVRRNHPGHRTGAHTTRVNHKGAHAPAEVRTTRTETVKVWAVPMCTTRRGGVIGPHAHGSMGRQVVDDQNNTWRGGATGPRAHRNAARHMVNDLNVEGSGQQNCKTTPATTSTTPVCPLLGSANTEMTPQGTQAAATVRTQ